MTSFSEIIDSFGGSAKFAAAIRITDSHARVMKARDSIPPEYWVLTVRAAELLAIKGITHELLATLRSNEERAA